MKKIFCNLNGSVEENRKNNIIKQRIERMSKVGLFRVVGLPKTYILDSNKVFLKKFTFPNRKARAIAILINKKWEVFEI